MADSKGISKKHSPLQKAHYQAYKLGNHARRNLIRRLKARVRRNVAKWERNDKRRAERRKLSVKAKAKRVPVAYVKPDKGAVMALKLLGVTVENGSDWR